MSFIEVSKDATWPGRPFHGVSNRFPGYGVQTVYNRAIASAWCVYPKTLLVTGGSAFYNPAITALETGVASLARIPGAQRPQNIDLHLAVFSNFQEY